MCRRRRLSFHAFLRRLTASANDDADDSNRIAGPFQKTIEVRQSIITFPAKIRNDELSHRNTIENEWSICRRLIPL